MFKYSRSLNEIKSLGKTWRNLPVDFGAMYFLFPPEEDIRFFGSRTSNRIAAMVSSIQERFKKKDGDMDYYRTNLFC